MKKIIAFALTALLAIPVFSQSAYYEGDGGKGLSIEVAAPKVSGKVTDEQEWFPDFAANMIHDDMEKYSAIRMIDGTNIEAQIDIDERNMNSGLFEGSDAINYHRAENTLFITLNVTPGGYNLSVRVNQGNTTKASYNKSHTIDDMNSGLALKTATADLLDQLGVKLTETGRDSLLAVVQSQGSVEAQKLNAQAKIAEQKGDSLTALTYLVQAKKNDAKLKRTSTAINSLSSKVASGNIGEQARNQIQLRKDFIKLLDETESYLKQNPPFVLFQYGELKLGKIDYEKERMKVAADCYITIEPDAYAIIESVKDLYKTLPDSSNWGVKDRVYDLEYYLRGVGFCFLLVDEQGNPAARCCIADRCHGWCSLRYYDSRLPMESYKITLGFGLPAETNTANLKLKLAKIMKSVDYYYFKYYNYYYADNNAAHKDTALKVQKKIDNEKSLYPVDSVIVLSMEEFMSNYVITEVESVDGINVIIGKSIYLKLLKNLEVPVNTYVQQLYPNAKTERHTVYNALKNREETERKLKEIGKDFKDLNLPFIVDQKIKEEIEAVEKEKQAKLLNMVETKSLPMLYANINVKWIENTPEMQEKLGCFYDYAINRGYNGLNEKAATFDDALISAYKTFYPSIEKCVDAFSNDRGCRRGNVLAVRINNIDDVYKGADILREQSFRQFFSQEANLNYNNRNYKLYRLSESGYNKLREYDKSLPPFESVPAEKIIKQVISDIKEYTHWYYETFEAPSEYKNLIENNWFGNKMVKDMRRNKNHIYLFWR